jgi:antibiotic biosynthesis monooxygenase (ABM) superfamily enzyme
VDDLAGRAPDSRLLRPAEGDSAALDEAVDLRGASQPDGPTGIITKIVLASAGDPCWPDWQAAFTRAAAASPGFLSLEIIPLAAGGVQWRAIQRFSSGQTLQGWQRSAARRQAMARLAALQPPGMVPDEEPAPDFHAISAMTEVITTTVTPGREAAFHDWSSRVQAAQSAFPGYLGTLVQAPVSSALPYWTTLVRFASPAQLDAWLGSAERRRLLETSDPEIATWRSHRMASPFAGWFPDGEDAPPAWKQSALVLLVLFPVVMLEIRFLSPLLVGTPLPVATFIGNAISVAVTSWPLMTLAILALGWWLRPRRDSRVRLEVLGIAAVVALYLAEIALFWIAA